MTLDDVAQAVQRMEALERRVRELEAANAEPKRELGYTVKEIAASVLKGVPEPTIRAWIASGKLKAFTYPGSDKKIVFRSDLEAFIRAHPAAPEGDATPIAGASVEEATRRILAKHNRKAG